ncbi:gamma-glutamylcyclotransferase [Deferribacter thermophilus]|uniref:gamma-glutamylcyclotransferase family protein n=1 Tax=Deferribacter thermophilus TaxID=53573 RepID=UPI003C26C4BF
MYEYFFFYGTLRFGCPISTIILKNAKYITSISLPGSLYLSDDKYPVYVPENTGVVIGDIFKVPSNLIPHLDEYEDINSDYTPYKRVQMEKNNLKFWIYTANNSFLKNLSMYKKIPSGDWLKYYKKRYVLMKKHI